MLAAATELLVEGGPAAVTVDAIVAASGVAKSTIYRHWESRDEILRDTVAHLAPSLEPPPAGTGFDAALRGVLRQVVATFNDPEWARVLPALLMLKQLDHDLASVDDDLRRQHVNVLGAILREGEAAGRLRGGIVPERAAAQLIGPLLFAHLSGATEVDDAFANDVVDAFLAAHAPVS